MVGDTHIMFKLKEYHNDKKDLGFAMQVMNPWDDCHESKPHCLYNIKLGCRSWWWHGPQIFKPQEKWIDLSKESWATVGKDGRKGYTEHIQRSYGFTFVGGSGIHVHYGIQPGSWSRSDPKNSDHTKVFNYFWNWHHVRHSAYDVDGNYLCNGIHFLFWELHAYEKDYTSNEKPEFERPNIVFRYPKDDGWNNTLEGMFSSNYTNFSDKKIPSDRVFKFYDYYDPYGKVSVRTRVNIEERQWIRGKWKWLRAILRFLPGCNGIQRTIDIKFQEETGSGRGSWKGGTLGCSFKMIKGETIDQCWDRFQREWKND